jgi:hypothetical protein
MPATAGALNAEDGQMVLAQFESNKAIISSKDHMGSAIPASIVSVTRNDS